MSIESSSEVIQNTQNRTMEYVADYIQKAYEANHAVTSTNINDDIFPGFNKKHVGKVRDSFICDDFIVIVTTDRQSAFDRQLASVPFKGQVLNLASYWWFNQTQSFVPNHIIACPHPNVIIGRKCSVFPVEFVMRGYITGTTNTSMWTNYANGVRNYCGHIIPEGLLKNQKLGSNLLTPTTKDDLHDELISAEEVVKSNRMTQEEWDTCSTYAHKLFHFGQMKALERGLILVDTKYEFGKDKDGKIFLIDEIHTPDSSRYWIADTYEQRMSLQQVSHKTILILFI